MFLNTYGPRLARPAGFRGLVPVNRSTRGSVVPGDRSSRESQIPIRQSGRETLRATRVYPVSVHIYRLAVSGGA